eukprot:XP_001690653.1 predicted protein [Chlamydomonas reinhardtii]
MEQLNNNYRDKEGKELYPGGLLPEGEAHIDVVHVVAGDFNTQNYCKALMGAKAKGPKPSKASQADTTPEPQFLCLHSWLSYQGSKEQRSEPSTAANFPDVVYVLKSSAEKAQLYNTGFQVLPLARAGSKTFMGGSDHKPVLVSFREEGQWAMPVRSLAVAVSSILRGRVQEAVNEMRAEVQAKLDLLVQAVPAQAVLAQLHEAHPMQNVWNWGGLR